MCHHPKIWGELEMISSRRRRLNTSLSANQESTSSTNARAAKRKKKDTLRRILGDVGVILHEDQPGIPVELECDQISLQRKLVDELKTQEVQTELVHDLEEMVKNSDSLRMLSNSTRFTSSSGLSTRPGGQDSVLRLLLGVEPIQLAVVDCLLERVASLMEDDEELVLFALEQLKWLDRLVNGEELCDKLLDIMSAAPLIVKKGIVIMLPAILQDDQHLRLATSLKEKLSEDEELVPAIVECLGNLNVTDPVLISDVLETAVNAVGSISNLADIPILIRFVIQNTDAKNMLSMVQELRCRLDCFDSSFVPPSHSSTQGISKGLHLPGETAIVEALKYSIWFQKIVADAWMKSVQLVREAKDHKVIDTLVLLILYSIPTRKKAVENLFVIKVKSKHFTEEYLDIVFGIGPDTLKEYFPSILSLSSDLLCVHNASVVSFASAMYQNAFKCFDVFCKQEVVGALVTHVGSGSRPEVDAAFDVLSLLTRTNSAQMRRFDMFIKGILDYLEKLEVSQIRKLYTIVSILAQDEDSGIGDEMRTIIGKQLSHSTRKFRRIGIVGGVMMIKEFGRKSAADDFSMDVDKPMPVSPSPSQQLSTAKSLLDQVMSDGCRSADMTILFNDELSMVVKEGNLDPKFLRDLLAQATDTLEELYLIESSDPLPIGDAVLYEYKAGLDSADACAIALNLMPLVLKQYDSLRKGLVDRSSVMCLPSHFHLLRTCVSVVNGGDLGDIDALLGCPVVMCTSDQLLPESYQGLAESVKNSICLALYLCLNWYLESVCAFAAEEDMDMQWKVMKRLQNVIEVETQLESCIALTPSFIGFLHRVLGIEMETSISGHGSGKKSTTKNKSKTSANTTAASTTLEVTHDHTFTDKAPSSILDVVRQFYRPLSVEVFRVLSYEPIQRPLSQDSQESLIQSTPHVSEMIKVELSMVVFLLDNLYWKVFSALTTFGGKKGPHSKFAHYDSDMGPSPAELIKLVISLLPSLCQYVEASSSYFQTQSENNDGVEDMFDMESTEAKIHSSILSTTLKIFSTVLAWPKLTEQENKDIVSDMAHTLADRIGSSSASSVTRIFKRGLTYLKGFGSSMPTLSCAQCLVKCLVHFCKVDPGFTEEGREQVADLCIYLLKKSWSDFDKIQQHKEAIGVILKFSITWSKDPLQQIENVIQDNFVRHLEGGLVQDSPDKDSERCNEVYATFSVKTMSCYYQTLLVALVEAVKASLSTKPATVSAEVQDRGLAILAVAFKIFQMLVNLVKTTEKRPFLGAALKYGRLLVEAFLRQGMPLLYEVFRTKQDEVLVLLKSLQHSTRSLQHFCGHSKVQKDITLTNRVPGLKKSLETLLFRVKCLLTEHNCQEAFWVGNLKNRDIHGQEISSQLPPPVSPEPEEDTESAGTTTATPEGDQDEMEEVLSSDSE